MNEYTPQTVIPGTQYCGSRLPCGLCLITNQPCPMMPMQWQITCTAKNEVQT